MEAILHSWLEMKNAMTILQRMKILLVVAKYHRLASDQCNPYMDNAMITAIMMLQNSTNNHGLVMEDVTTLTLIVILTNIGQCDKILWKFLWRRLPFTYYNRMFPQQKLIFNKKNLC